MIPVIGILVVFGCIAGGYLMEKGNMLVLMQPAAPMLAQPASRLVNLLACLLLLKTIF